MTTLNVQDDEGTTVNANTYISEADADSYFADVASPSLALTWDAASSAEKITALINAWQYLDYEYCFVGYQLTDDQTTEWPRAGAYWPKSGYVIDDIPTNLTYAQCEYAVRALAGPLVPDITYDDNKMITKLKQKVGPVETDTTYDGNAGYLTSRSFPSADRLLKGLIVDSGTVERG